MKDHMTRKVWGVANTKLDTFLICLTEQAAKDAADRLGEGTTVDEIADEIQGVESVNTQKLATN